MAKKELWALNETDLIKLVGQGTYPGADKAWDDFQKIRDSDGEPHIYYSESDSFTVLDCNDPDNMQHCISMEDRAKRWRR